MVLATTAAGVLPYQADLTTIDMLGLTDAHVARHGAVVSERPGHQRVASLFRGPWREPRAQPSHDQGRALRPRRVHARDLDIVLADLWFWFALPRERVPEHAALVAIPVRDGRVVLAVYLVRHPVIER
ncbi:MAG: hypothetical protein H6732_14235 [Alphaproteobacteria bacterium]|nr:hypothetical protein [Alphaproteobacteria bacterium]